MSLIVVVFPAPLGPRSPNTSPWPMDNDNPLTAETRRGRSQPRRYSLHRSVTTIILVQTSDVCTTGSHLHRERNLDVLYLGQGLFAESQTTPIKQLTLLILTAIISNTTPDVYIDANKWIDANPVRSLRRQDSGPDPVLRHLGEF
jgi:hypothetical protein